MTIETISEEEYEERVETITEVVLEEYDEGDELHDLVHDVMDGDEWFIKGRFGPAAHGCIVEHSDQEPAVYGGWDRHQDSESLGESLRRLSFRCLKGDVTSSVEDRV